LAGVIVCRHPEAKQEAWVVTILSGPGVKRGLARTFLKALQM